MDSHYNLEADIKAAIAHHPGLNLDTSGDKFRISGDIDVRRPEDGAFITSFSVELSYPDEFPKCFPKVIETGGRIERIPDRHVNPSDNTLCFTVPIEEKLLCLHGISTSWFLDNILVPRLGEEYQVINGGRYSREYSHGINGRWEFYMKWFNVTSTNRVLAILNDIINNTLPKGFLACFCESGRKFKQCHLKKIVELKRVGMPYLRQQYQLLSANPYSHPKKNN